MSHQPQHSLTEVIDLVEAGLEDAARAAGTFADDPYNWRRRYNGELALLADRLALQAGAIITSRWDGARVRMLGITATSTSSTGGALRNWLTAARGRVEQAGA